MWSSPLLAAGLFGGPKLDEVTPGHVVLLKCDETAEWHLTECPNSCLTIPHNRFSGD